jgi:prepilin-type N-terminal cleavage/methylation domain-containing protein
MKNQRGLSLIELMIAILISSLLLIGVLELFINTNSADRSNTALNRTQESGRLLLEIIGTDVRRAGYQGCSAASTTTKAGTYNFPADALGAASNSVTMRYATRGDTGTLFGTSKSCANDSLYLYTATYSNCPQNGILRICKSTNGGTNDPIVDNARITSIQFAVPTGGNLVWTDSASVSAAELATVGALRLTLEISEPREAITHTYNSTYQLRNRI